MVKISSWGSGGSGCLAQGHGGDVDKPTLSLVRECYLTATSGVFSLFLSTDRTKLYGCGETSFGKLGSCKEEYIYIPRDTGFIFLTKVKKISCGWRFAMALLEDGSIHSWGEGKYFQLGNGTNENSKIPFKVDCIPGKAVDIACGWKHALVALEDGNVYGWGTNKAGQLGTTESIVSSPMRVPVDSIISVKCGWRHSLFLNSLGAVLTLGCNRFGQRGVSESSRSHMPNSPSVVISGSELPLGNIKKIDCGWHFNAALSSDGEVWLWGKGMHGQLGISLLENQCKANKVPLGCCIKDICCGSEHCMALDVANRLFAWGWNEHGNIGKIDVFGAVVSKPVLLLEENMKQRRMVSGGASVFLIED